MSGYAVLRREAQANQDLYDALYARVKEAGISAASKSSNITIADKARVLDSPTWPRLSLMLPIAFLVSWVGGAAAGLLRDSVDRSVRSADDVPNMHSNQALVLVPDFNPKHSVSFGRDRPRLGLPRKSQDHGLNKFMLGRLDSPEAESLQSLSSTIMLAHRQSRLKAFLVTSPLPQEGKTTLSYNLAIALAANGKTCFLNADLRKAGSQIEPGDQEYAGITDYCKEKATLKEIETQSGDHPELIVVHCGKRRENATQVLMSNRFQDLVTELRARYEFLIIDSPPILPFADACFLGAVSDGAIVVAKSATTDRGSLENALEKLYLLAVPVLGVALNGVSAKELPYRRYHASVGVK